MYVFISQFFHGPKHANLRIFAFSCSLHICALDRGRFCFFLHLKKAPSGWSKSISLYKRRVYTVCLVLPTLWKMQNVRIAVKLTPAFLLSHATDYDLITLSDRATVAPVRVLGKGPWFYPGVPTRGLNVLEQNYGYNSSHSRRHQNKVQYIYNSLVWSTSLHCLWYARKINITVPDGLKCSQYSKTTKATKDKNSIFKSQFSRRFHF